mmetsp:Transcript_1658/g.3524  ORF Transcript_1658/g.3524 Transcript_1658/m.3524 type:complete len:222 (+) Transcript_1658:820-1485(+)
MEEGMETVTKEVQPLNTVGPRWVFWLFWNSTPTKLTQSTNALSLISSIEGGSDSPVKETQLAKARSSIVSRPLPKLTSLKNMQFVNACSSMNFTVEGRVISFKPQKKKASTRIFSRPCGIMISLRLAQYMKAPLLTELNVEGNFTWQRDWHAEAIPRPVSVSPHPRMSSPRRVQLAKALSPRLTTVDGTSISFNWTQSLKASCPILSSPMRSLTPVKELHV